MGLECQILLNAPKEGVYKSTQPVTGVLKYTLDKKTCFESIILKLIGKGKCSWSTSDSDSTTYHKGKENYITMTKIIMQGEHHLKTGFYSNNFEFFIPECIPSSFKDNVCTIAYKIKAEFVKPKLFNKKKKFKTEITLYGNLEPCSPQPLIFGLTKNPFSIGLPSAIDLKIEIEKTFLMPGENIKLNCSIQNNSDLTVNSVQSKLITEITYTSDSNTKKVQKKAIKESFVETPGVIANSVANYTYIVPTLPNLYSIQHSRIMMRQYKLHVTAKLPFPHRDASVEIPVVIGEGHKSNNIVIL